MDKCFKICKLSFNMKVEKLIVWYCIERDILTPKVVNDQPIKRMNKAEMFLVVCT